MANKIARWETRGRKHYFELIEGKNEHGIYWEYRGNGCGGCLGGSNNGMTREKAMSIMVDKVLQEKQYNNITMKAAW